MVAHRVAAASTARSSARRYDPFVIWAISAGGALGALARYALATAWPASPTGFPWAIFTINVSGCLLIGVLMVLVSDVWSGHRLLRPFLGIGVLGGYTTFSTYVVDIQRLVTVGVPGIALLYLAGTVVAAVTATFAGITLTGRLVRA